MVIWTILHKRVPIPYQSEAYINLAFGGTVHNHITTMWVLLYTHHNMVEFITDNNSPPNLWIQRKLRLENLYRYPGTGWHHCTMVVVVEYLFSIKCWSLLWILIDDEPHVGVGVIRWVQGIMMLFLHGSAWCYSSFMRALDVFLPCGNACILFFLP